MPGTEKNREELLQIMADNGLKAEDLPALTGYSKSMVDAWMMGDRESARARPVSERALSLLTLNIKAAKANLNK